MAQLGFELCFVWFSLCLFVVGFFFHSVGLILITNLTMRVKIAKLRSLSYLVAFSKTHYSQEDYSSPRGGCCARVTTSPGASS